ncbi:MAG: biotin--[acetyl-CoA-carboxylase] ligase [Bacteroidetes bacterium]|nr:MAG: biotin--[acetyl-CoA-carboxylase] ligase [Bacteroidota bacterium]
MTLDHSKFSFEKVFLKEVDSTNKELIRRLNTQSLNEGFLVQAAFQSGGKGQGDNQWESEGDKNLLFSFLLRPQFLAISNQFYITIITSLALADSIRSLLLDEVVKIKWPNDIYVGRKKIAGVLIENAIQGDTFDWVVIGIGVNVNQQHFTSDAPNPISLIQILEEETEINEVLALFETQFANRYAQLQSGDWDGLKQDYLNSLYQYKEWKNYHANNQNFRGQIIGIDEYGFLRIESQKGIRSFDAKEVEYL